MIYYGSNKDTPKTPKFVETSRYPNHSQSQIKFSIENGKENEKLSQTKECYSLFGNNLQH